MTENTPYKSWQTTPSGELGRVVLRIRSQRQQRLVGRAVSWSVAILLVAATIGYVASTALAPPGGIACEEVVPLKEQYLERELAGGVNAQVYTHLQGCRECREFYYGEMPAENLPTPSRLSQGDSHAVMIVHRGGTR